MIPSGNVIQKRYGMMKKIIAMILSLILSLIGGCSGTHAPENAKAPNVTVNVDISQNISGLPDEVLEAAKEAVSLAAEKDAEITGISMMNTGTVGNYDGINMYRIEYISDGIVYSDRYVLLYFYDTDDAPVWQPVSSVTESDINELYDTPEMLEKYGNKYTAAAMEILHGFKNDG